MDSILDSTYKIRIQSLESLVKGHEQEIDILKSALNDCKVKHEEELNQLKTSYIKKIDDILHDLPYPKLVDTSPLHEIDRNKRKYITPSSNKSYKVNDHEPIKKNTSINCYINQ